MITCSKNITKEIQCDGEKIDQIVSTRLVHYKKSFRMKLL
jgi:hypothetical protein